MPRKPPRQTDEPAFVAGILEHPADVLRRLVYADWLDENGEPERATFIRWQNEREGEVCQRARIVVRDGGRRVGTFRDLLAVRPWDPAWSGIPSLMADYAGNSHLVVTNRSGSSAVFWHRGFLTAVYAPGCRFGKGVRKELASHPLRVVHLRGRFQGWDLGHTPEPFQDGAEFGRIKKDIPTVERVLHDRYRVSDAAKLYGFD